ARIGPQERPRPGRDRDQEEVDDDGGENADDEQGDRPQRGGRGPVGQDHAVHEIFPRPLSVRTISTNANENPNRIRPIVHSASFHGSPWTVLPMSSVIWLVSVVTGWVSAVGITGRLPITIWTASASPAARIMPSTMPVAIPDNAAGMSTWRIVCQRVVPRAS